MAKKEYPDMTMVEVKEEINNLKEGQRVAFVAEDQNRYKLKFSYRIDSIEPGPIVDVAGRDGGEWRFVIEDGLPQLRYKSPSSGWQNAGALDYVEGRE